jgi:hypothetical protein
MKRMNSTLREQSIRVHGTIVAIRETAHSNAVAIWHRSFWIKLEMISPILEQDQTEWLVAIVEFLNR